MSLNLDARKYAFKPESDVQWWFLGSFLSACDDPLYPFDRDVVRAIRTELDPWFVPLVRKTVYQNSAGGERVWTHHVWARVIPDPDESIAVRRIRKPVLWPSSPGATNRAFASYSDRLIFESDIGFVGNSERMPGRFRPIGWAAFKDIKKGYDYSRAVDAEEHARAQLRHAQRTEESRTAEADDLVEYAYDSNRRRFDGNPLVSVPSTFGEAA